MRAANTNGSIIEEDEGGSSDDEPQGNLVMHTNVYDNRAPENNPKPVSSPPALQEVESMSSRRGTKGRKATSDVGVLAPYSPLTRRREPLRRTVSNDHVDSRSRGSARSDAGSETSSMRRGKKRNGGFFASIARFFKGPKRQRESGRASPAPGGGWHTRTEDNIKRGSTVGRRRRGRSDSSSSDEDTRNFVAVSNIDREFGGWSAADVGRDRSTARPGMKRSGSTRSKSTAVSHSTVTARRAFSPTLPAASSTAGPSRSNTVRKAASASGEKTRKHGSIARSKGAGTANKRASQPPENIEDLAHLPPPQMPDVPKAPIAGLTPKLELARAPGSSIQPTNKANDPTLMMPSEMIAYLPRKGDDELRPSDSISRSNSRTKPSKKAEGKRRSSVNDEARNEVRPVSPLPPSKLRSPPLKSAMRPTSPSPPMSLEPPPVIDTLYSVSAPGPVNLPPAPEPEPTNVIRPKSRGSNNGDDNSVYESANEDAAAALEDSDDDDVTELGNYTVVANEKATATLEPAAPLATGPPVPATTTSDVPVLPPIPTAPLLTDDNKLGRRKSVRMNLPAEEGSPTSRIHDGPALLSEREKEHARHADAAIIAEAEASSPPRPARRRRDESPPVSREHMVWDTRIGRVRDDTSDEDDENPLTEDYARAHKSLTKNNGDFSDVVDNAKQDSKKGKKRKSLLRGKRK
jgi:hypothetical protein